MSSAVAAEKRRPGRPAGAGGTRERILETTISELATHGFYGTTVRSIADEVGVTTASLLHHFPTKESLYSEVLERIAASLGAWPASDHTVSDPVERVVALIDGFFVWVESHDEYSRILLRELMDNVGRAAHARRWHLAPVTRQAVDIVRDALAELAAAPSGGAANAHARQEAAVDPEMLVFQLIGAVVYFFVSLPTAERILESGARAEILERFRTQLHATTAQALLNATGRPSPSNGESK
jgi:TetR/AcrR family transcriptional regulator